MMELRIPGHQTLADLTVLALHVVTELLIIFMVKFVTKVLVTLGPQLMVAHLTVLPTFAVNLYISTLPTTLQTFFQPKLEFTGTKALMLTNLTMKLLTGLSSLLLNPFPNASWNNSEWFKMTKLAVSKPETTDLLPIFKCPPLVVMA